ncbi:unnamed protein product [Gordionus sp. m RMFG-2023]
MCRARAIMDVQLVSTGIWHLAFLAFDQYLALRFPLFYKFFASNKGPSSKGSLTYIGVIATTWLISMTFSIFYILRFPNSVVSNTFSNYTDLCHESYEGIFSLHYNDNISRKSGFNRNYTHIFNRYSYSTTFNASPFYLHGKGGYNYYQNITEYDMIEILAIQDMNQCLFNPNLIMGIVGPVVSFFVPLMMMLYFFVNIIVMLRHKIQSTLKYSQTLPNGGKGYSKLVNKKNFLNKITTLIHKLCLAFANILVIGLSKKDIIVNGDHSFPKPSYTLNNNFIEKMVISSTDNVIFAVTQFKPNILKSQNLLVERKAIYYILTILILFMICWIPYFIYFFLLSFFRFESPYWLFDLLTWLGYMNSAINPILYFFMHKEFKAKGLKKTPRK